MAVDQTKASLSLLFDISRELTNTLDLRKVLDRVILLAVTNTGAERGTVIVLDQNQQPVNAAIVYEGSPHPYTVEQLRDILDHGLAGWVLDKREPALISDTSNDERWLRRPADMVDRSEAKSAICVPLMTGDRIVGVLTMVHPMPGFFNSDNYALAQAIADMAGIAIHNAQLFADLQLAHQRYHDLFEDSIDPIILTNIEGVIQEANRQAVRMSGFEDKILIGRSVIDLQLATPEILEDCHKGLAEGQTTRFESQLVRGAEKPIPVEVYVRGVVIEDKPSLQWIMQDISQKRELDSLREDLTAMIYHDLRSPLSNIISSLDILSSMLPMDTSPTLSSVFQITTRSADRMQRLISSLIDINRLETGQPITTKKTVNIIELAQEAVDAVKPSMESKQQKLILGFPQEMPILLVDVDMIRRVLINLLENAVKFTPVNSDVEFGGKEEEDSVLLWVVDSGPGIPPQAHQTIFEKFTRLKTEGGPKGIGLGLAFCRLAVEAHGGKIWVESEVGKGSKFLVRLPVNKPITGPLSNTVSNS